MAGNILPWWSNLWCMQQTVPFVLDTSTLSALEILNKLVLAVDELIKDGKLTATEIETIKQHINELDRKFEDWSNGKFDDVIKDEVTKWVADNVKYIFETYCKQVFFGLTENGHFCAFIPQSWREIIFDTGAVFGTPEYGRLILKYSYVGAAMPDNQFDYTELYKTIESIVELELGDGLKLENEKVTVNLGENLTIKDGAITVPTADSITKGVVKLSHTVENETDSTVAVSPQAVFAYAQPKNQ